VVQISACADDVVVISRNVKAMEKALQDLVNTAQEMRMIINKKQIM